MDSRLRHLQKSVFSLVSIFFIHISTILIAGNAYCDWELRKTTIGEDLPADVVENYSTDKSLNIFVLIASDEICIPDINIFQGMDRKYNFDKFQTIEIITDKNKSFIYKLHKANFRIFQVMFKNEEQRLVLLNQFETSDQLELVLKGKNIEVKKSFLRGKQREFITKTRDKCDSILLSENEFILPDSSQRKLEKGEIAGYTKRVLRIARNEIFARHGYVFKSDDLIKRFKKYKWYRPKTEQLKLSKIEKANISLISLVEKRYY